MIMSNSSVFRTDLVDWGYSDSAMSSLLMTFDQNDLKSMPEKNETLSRTIQWEDLMFETIRGVNH